MDLFQESNRMKMILSYMRHIDGDYDYSIDVEPMPTPRPRSRIQSTRNGGQKCEPYVLVYHPSEYTSYKKEIAILLKDAKLKLKKGDYASLFLTLHMPYPASTPKKNLIEGTIHRKKPDWDNYVKGFQDALADAGVLINGDGAIGEGCVLKRYTLRPKGFIRFNLS